MAASAAATVLFVIASGVYPGGFSASESGFATNGYGDRSPGGYDTDGRHRGRGGDDGDLRAGHPRHHRHERTAGLRTRSRSGCALTIIHLATIPVSNTSVNPARSTGPALFAGSEALQQLWVFWLVPIVAALAAGALYAWLFAGREPVEPARGGQRSLTSYKAARMTTKVDDVSPDVIQTCTHDDPGV